MAYKYSKGKTFQGDIYNEDDSQKNTYIDFGADDYIGLVASGSSVLVVSGSQVGIGTVSPSQTLHVSGNTRVEGSVSASAGLYGTDLVLKTNAASNIASIYIEGTSGTEIIGLAGGNMDIRSDGGSLNLLAGTGSPLYLGSDNQTYRVTLDTDGNVGIGTTSPQALLHITGNLDPVLLIEDGNIHLSGTNPSHNPEIQFIDNAHIATAGLKIRYDNGTGNSHIENMYNHADRGIIFTTRESAGGDDALALIGGKAGIGTTSPLVSLDVHYTGSGDPTNLDDDKGGGDVVYFGSGSLTAGALHYLNEDGGWAETSAAAVGDGHDQLLGIPLGTDPSSDGVLIKGYYHADTYLSGAFRKGKPIYVCSSSVGQYGFMSGAAPTAANSYLRVVGYGTSVGNVIYFNPDSIYVELS